MEINRETLVEWLTCLDLAHQDGIDNGRYEGSICHQQIESVRQALRELTETPFEQVVI